MTPKLYALDTHTVAYLRPPLHFAHSRAIDSPHVIAHIMCMECQWGHFFLTILAWELADVYTTWVKWWQVGVLLEHEHIICVHWRGYYFWVHRGHIDTPCYTLPTCPLGESITRRKLGQVDLTWCNKYNVLRSSYNPMRVILNKYSTLRLSGLARDKTENVLVWTPGPRGEKLDLGTSLYMLMWQSSHTLSI